MRALLWAAALLALSACTTPPVAPVASISAADGVLTFDGPIQPGSLEKVQQAVASQSIHTLKIRSGGGSVIEAIGIARWMHGNGVNVVVYGGCFSSCANYIFPAGKEKHIVNGGIVGWHGSFEHRVYQHKQGVNVVDKDELAQFELIARRERALYAELGVNGYLAWFAKIAPYKVYNMYFLSKEDMEYFGLTGLHVRADYLSTDLARWNSREKDTLQLVHVDRSVTNSSDPHWEKQ